VAILNSLIAPNQAFKALFHNYLKSTWLKNLAHFSPIISPNLSQKKQP